jgi:hypothetical protein
VKYIHNTDQNDVFLKHNGSKEMLCNMVPKINLSKRVVDSLLYGAWKELREIMAVEGGYISGSVSF